MRKLLLPFIAVAAAPLAFSQGAAPNGWLDPFPPHKIMDNFFYVGTKELSTFLITTPQGHILMNSNYEASVPIIKKNVEDLGFKFSDVKILIAGHAHPDHVQGDNAVKELTNAQVVVGKKDEEDTKKNTPAGKVHPIDRLINDGDTVSLGGVTLTAHEMPGHTPGCLAWTLDLKENGKTYKGFVECSLNGRFVSSLTQYPGILDDFRATYKKARTIPVEVWVSSHASFYNLPQKYEKLKAMKPGDPNPFIDPQGYKDHVDEYEKSFEAALAAPAQGKGKGGFGQGKGPGAAKQ